MDIYLKLIGFENQSQQIFQEMNDEERLMVEELDRVEAEERRLRVQPPPFTPNDQPPQPRPQVPQPNQQPRRPQVFQGHISREVRYDNYEGHQ